MTDLIPLDDFAQFRQAVADIQQPRTPFELTHFVVGQHESEPRAWAQCTLVLSIKLRNLRRAQISERQIQRKIKRLESLNTDAAADKAELLRLDLEEQSLAVLGAQRESEALYAIWKSFGRTYSRDELNAAETEYWQRRLTRQAMLDMNASGRIGVGNQDALRMAGMPVPGLPTYTQQVEQRFLEVGKVRILIAVPTLIPRDAIERDGLECLKGWSLPGTIEQKVYVITGKPVAEAYTDAALTAMRDGCDYLLTVEDDHVIPQGTFEKIWIACQQHGPLAIVGAWYARKAEPRTGAAIVLVRGKREYLNGDGSDTSGSLTSPIVTLREVYTIPQGFTLIPVSIFRKIPQPWFETTGNLTQDSFFSQLAREAGYKLLVDTSVRIKHICRETGRVYE